MMTRLEVARYLTTEDITIIGNTESATTYTVIMCVRGPSLSDKRRAGKGFSFSNYMREECGIFSYTSHTRGLNHIPSDLSLWKKETYQSLLHILRSEYPRRTETQCDYVSDCGARCVQHVTEHSHCKSCSEACDWQDRHCPTCRHESQKMREEITRKIEEYENRYGITFAQDERLRYYPDDGSDISGYRRDREDFHADG